MEQNQTQRHVSSSFPVGGTVAKSDVYHYLIDNKNVLADPQLLLFQAKTWWAIYRRYHSHFAQLVIQ